VRVVTRCRIEAIAGRHLRAQIGDAAPVDLPIGDALVFAHGPRPNIDVIEAVEATRVPYARVGDCRAPGDFLGAIRDAWMVALSIDNQPLQSTTGRRTG